MYAFLERPSVLSARQQPRHIEAHQSLVRQPACLLHSLILSLVLTPTPASRDVLLDSLIKDSGNSPRRTHFSALAKCTCTAMQAMPLEVMGPQ